MSFLNRLSFLTGMALLAIPAFSQTCTILVPSSPLTAAGLATPYQMQAGCDETNSGVSLFVQAAIFDPNAHTVSVYNPLVINAGTSPAAPPVVPTIPSGATVALFFGSNNNGVILMDHGDGTLTNTNCVQLFASQFAYCNAVNFYTAVNNDIAAHNLTVPALGTGADGQACPTARSFGVVDQDQSDNQTTWYLIVPQTMGPSLMAQYNAANVTAFPGATVLQNPSDEWLVSEWMDAALGCTPWMVPDLTNGGTLVPSMATNEIQAAMYQKAPIALVPLGDPFTQAGDGTAGNSNTNLQNTNLYRAGVNQAPGTANTASTTTYCTNMRSTGAQKLLTDAKLFTAAPSPLPAVGNSLYTTLATRFMASYNNLNCQALTHQPNPVTITGTDMNGVTTSVTIKPGASGIQ